MCSAWMFARLFAFVLLWKWTWWHYRFRFLAGAFALMIAGFAGIVLARSPAMLLAAQAAFGVSVGLIYYSSLYYSMNVSSERGAHGGLHEAMIGAGLFAGPACRSVRDSPRAGVRGRRRDIGGRAARGRVLHSPLDKIQALAQRAGLRNAALSAAAAVLLGPSRPVNFPDVRNVVY